MSPAVPQPSRRPSALQAALVAGLAVVLISGGLPPSLRAADPAPQASQAPSTPAPQPASGKAILAADTPAAVMAVTGSGDGLFGRYYPNTQTWSGAASLERVDPTIDFDWSGTHPVAADDFSVAWSGAALIPCATGAGLALRLGRTAERAAADANKLHHIFGFAKHNLADVVAHFGSEEAAFDAIQRAAQEAAGQQGLSGVFQVSVNVGGFAVTVSGKVIDGIARIGTVFRP